MKTVEEFKAYRKEYWLRNKEHINAIRKEYRRRPEVKTRISELRKKRKAYCNAYAKEWQHRPGHWEAILQYHFDRNHEPLATYGLQEVWKALVSKCKREGECLIWQGSIVQGFGYFSFKATQKYAHRAAYEIAFGSIPTDKNGRTMIVEQTCENRRCCEPKHLQVITIHDFRVRQNAERRRPVIMASI